MSALTRTPIPATTRTAVMDRCKGLCENCGEQSPLDLHHLNCDSDRPDRYEIFGHETPGDLAALCRPCHYGRHRDRLGDYWLDVEHMDAHWDKFDEEMAKD